MSTTILPASKRDFELQGRHVLAGFIAFFAVVFAVNGVLLFKALATHSGIVANEPYRKGLAYNVRISADEQQAALGWKAEIALDPTGQVSLMISDSSGRPVSGLRIAGSLGRPTTERHDLKVVFAEPEPGRYLAVTKTIDPGAWLLVIEARTSSSAATPSGDPVFRQRRKLWLRP